MDLTKHELVPLKTLLKRRDGTLAIFVNDEGGEKYRVCGAGTAGTYRIAKDGKKIGDLNNRQGQMDIVAIHKKWEPRAGDRVGVVGFLGNQAASVNDWQEGVQVFIIHEIYTPSSGRSLRYAWLYREGEQPGRTFYASIRNLVRATT